MMMITYQPQISDCRHQNYTVWHPQYDNPFPLHYSSSAHRVPRSAPPSLDSAPNRKPKRAAWKSKKSNFTQGRHFHKRPKTPSAPRNTTSFLIRAKKSGGIVSSSSSFSPWTPAVLPTPIFSPTKEVVVEMGKERWGIDGYGSMSGLIRLVHNEDVGDDGLSRFEMIYPVDGGCCGVGVGGGGGGGNGVAARLEEENLSLKERLDFVEKELEELRCRVRCLESTAGYGGSDEVCSEKSVGDGD